jgi:hypothetical protein
MQNEDEKVLDLLDNDKIEEESALMGIVSQEDDMLAFSIEGVYKDDKQSKYITGRKLKENPPVLKISSGTGEEVQFLLTKDFTRLLSKSLEEVNKAYSGYVYVKEKNNMTLMEKIKNIPNKIKEKPFESLLTIASIIVVIYVLIKGI